MVSTSELYNISHSIAMKNNGGFPSPTEWNTYANMAGTDLFNYYLGAKKDYFKAQGKPLPMVAPGVTEVVDQALLPFKINKVSLSVAGGQVTYTNGMDVEFIISVMTDYNGKLVNVKRLNDNKQPNIFSSTIDAPSLRYPAYSEINNGLEIYPLTATPILLTYYKTPIAAKWAYTLNAGRVVFDSANTVDFQFQSSDKINLLMRLLEYMGISVRDGELVQYAEQKQQTLS